MKLVQLSYDRLYELTDDLNATGMAKDLVAIVNDGPHVCALVRVSDNGAKFLVSEHEPALRAIHFNNARKALNV